MVRQLGASVAVFLLLVLAIPRAHAATADNASKFINGLGQRAFSTLNQESVPLDQKEAQVRKLLAENFDLELIGRYVVGPSWRTMNAKQREAYLAVFEEYVLRTYSKRLGGYSGQQFQISDVRTVGTDDHIVSTTIMRPGAPPIEAGWRVQTKTPQYKIVDVIVSGVSMVVTQRSEFSSVIQRQGVDGLIESLRRQVANIPAQTN